MTDILDVFPGAGLGQDEVVTEGELGEGEPGAVREDVEPEERGEALLCAPNRDTSQPVPEDAGDQTVLYLLPLFLTVQSLTRLHQPASN